MLLAAVRVLADLVKQGWSVRKRRSTLQVCRPENTAEDQAGAREHIRAQLHAERDEQLRQAPTASFVRSMEARRLSQNGFVSVFSLMRDGRELAASLRKIRDRRGDVDRTNAAQLAIRPYLQFFREDDLCPQTGLRLMDVWRYFRHTWANPYKSVPGRSMMVLVRDAAAPYHPVIGIAALSSAAVAMTARDETIGWTPAHVIAVIRERPTARLAAWLQRVVDEAIDEICKEDLLEDEVIAPRDLKQPKPEAIATLGAEAKQRRMQHHHLMQSGDYKKAENARALADDHWAKQARSPLFRSKRALELAQLLRVRTALRQFFGREPSKDGLLALVNDQEGRNAIARVVRRAKAERVGTAIADLSVCGAIPPYNEILGGKLVAMLVVSPEVLREYRKRYKGIPSVIASSMSGRAVSRPAHLVFIGTTSLYGQRPSQYDRVSIPCHPEGVSCDRTIRYEYLGKTIGIGTFQYGEETVRQLRRMLFHSKKGQQVNNVFGEGVNPRLRTIRDALNAMGLSSDELLNHGAPRLVYGVRLASNVHKYLLGIDKRPQYLFPQENAAAFTATITRWWCQRWLLHRIERDDVLDRVAQHNFVYPIRHGARVILPRADLEQRVLFEETESH
jgi:hypothetical protein